MLMKIRLTTVLGVIISSGFLLFPRMAVAAGCVVNDNGVAKVDIPTLPKTGLYTVWTRMQIPDTAHSRYQLEINGQTCYEVGSASLPTNLWAWVSYQGDNINDKVIYDFANNSGNSARLIGLDTGVKIDRIMLLQNGCLPEGTGDNCRSEAALINTDSTTLNNDKSLPVLVVGKVYLSPYVSQNTPDIKKLVYFSDGRKVQESNGPQPLDTTLLTNGPHTITSRITGSNGKSSDTISYVTAANSESSLTPISRWLRLNQHPLAVVGASFGAGSMLLLIFWSARSIQLERHRLKTHGF